MNRWIRQIHRWLSVAFTVAVIINIVTIVRGAYSNALGIVAVVPLVLLLVTGLYLLALPYAAKWRRVRLSSGSRGSLI
jgi:hypothetical protein